MKINRDIIIKSFKLKDNFNIDYSPYYIIDNGIYRFEELNIKLQFMHKYGITCQCERKMIDNKLTYCYNNIPITNEQHQFLQKRAQALSQEYNTRIGGYIKYDCGCKKQKRQE